MTQVQKLSVSDSLMINSLGSGSPIDESFDVALANAIAASETYNKHLFRPNTYLHKWWARRCGTTFRLILKSLVEDPALRDFYSPGGLEGKIILDPMMGGGTTLHEAVRLGANVVGADIEAIPVLQARASLSRISLEELTTAFEGFYISLRQKLAGYYGTICPKCGSPSEMQFMLYALRKECSCGSSLFVDSLALKHEANGSLIRLCPYCGRVLTGEENCPCGRTGKPLLAEKNTVACTRCGAQYRENTRITFRDRYVPIAVVGFCQEHGQFFKEPDTLDLEKLTAACQAYSAGGPFRNEDFRVEYGPKSRDLLARGVISYLDVYSYRQLLYLREAIRLLSNFDRLTRLNLALLVSTSLEFTSMLCGYKGAAVRRPGAIRHTFSHHAYSFPFTALESNPIFGYPTSGTLRRLFLDRIVRARSWAQYPQERLVERGRVTSKKVPIPGEEDAGSEVTSVNELKTGIRKFMLIHGSSTELDLPSESVDYVVTDPPYFDSVQYSDLARYFLVWLRKMLPGEIDFDYDTEESAVDPDGNGNGKYTEILSEIFSECQRVLKKPKGRLVFTYHHWNPKGWSSLSIALKRAGFVLVNYYVVEAENPASVHIANMNALTHDAILVLAPEGAAPEKHWPTPKVIDCSSSHCFVRDCAVTLGWVLRARMTEQEVKDIWQRLIPTTGRASTRRST